MTSMSSFDDARTRWNGNVRRNGYRATIAHSVEVGDPPRYMLVCVRVRCVTTEDDMETVKEDTVEEYMYGYKMTNAKLSMEEQWVSLCATVY
jgi:hypothetical protein